MDAQINDVLEELYSCLPNDRKKFNDIMANLKVKFLSETQNNNINQNSGVFEPKPNHMKESIGNNFYPGYMGSSEGIPQKAIPNFKPISLQSYVPQNNIKPEEYGMNNEEKKPEDPNNINFSGNKYSQTFNTLQSNNNNNYMNMNNNYMNSNYNTNINTEIHANLQHYYPDDYNAMYQNDKKVEHNNNIPSNWKNQDQGFYPPTNIIYTG